MISYMIENNKELNDISMIVIEECSEKDLEIREQFYIDYYKPQYVGFNQFNSLTVYSDLNSVKEKYIQDEIKEVPKWIEYGYTKFNMNIVYINHLYTFNLQKSYTSKNEFIKSLKIFIETYVINIDVYISHVNLLEEFQQCKSRLNYLEDKQKRVIEKSYSKFYNWAKKNIIEFEKNEKTRIRRESIFINMLENSSSLYGENSLEHDFSNTFSVVVAELEEIKMSKKNYQKEIKQKKDLLSQYFCKVFNFDRFKSKKLNGSFPLKSFNEKELSKVEDNKTIKVFILMGNNGRNMHAEPFILKVEISFFDNVMKSNVINKYYIKNQGTIPLKDGAHYLEKGFHPIDLSSGVNTISEYYGRTPFNVIPNNFGNYISINVEKKYGINDFLLKGVELKHFGVVLDELEKRMDENSVVEVEISEGNKAYKRAVQTVFSHDNDLYYKYISNGTYNSLRNKTPRNKKIKL